MKSPSRRITPGDLAGPLVLFVLLAACIVLCVVFWKDIWALATDPEKLSAWVAGLGAWGPIAFVAVQIVQVIVFVIPGEIPQVAGGMLFGVAGGTALSTLGIALGSAVNFYLARLLRERFVERVVPLERLERLQKILSSPRSVAAYFFLFLIPGIPKDVIAYAAGLSRVRFIAFIAVSSLGRLPALLVSVVAGRAMLDQNWAAAGALLGVGAVILVLGIIFRKPAMRFIERRCFVPGCPPPEETAGGKSDAPAGRVPSQTE
ncbi:MAG: TVP38/TMEM64 family protein [Spirochaetales bacterium]|nr:TVP38/TMEM64 family protein [Spirochaetales bacterium]